MIAVLLGAASATKYFSQSIVGPASALASPPSLTIQSTATVAVGATVIASTMTGCDPLTDDFQDGSLSEWTMFANNCTAPWSIQGSGNKYAAVTGGTCGCFPPESCMVRSECAYDDGYVECTIIQFGGGTCADSSAGGLILRAGTMVSDPLIAVSFRSAGFRVWAWDGDSFETLLVQLSWPVAAGDRVRVELVGDTMSIIHIPGGDNDPVPNTPIELVDDALEIGAGYCGLRVAHDSDGTAFDDYESGPLP